MRPALPLNMEWTCALLTLLLACVVTTGYCIPTTTVPPSGSNIAGFENEENIEVFCEVFNDQNEQQITRWHRAFEGDPLIPINVDDPQFTTTGAPAVGGLTFGTNLTILSLTADLDRMLLYCGIPGDERGAIFTMRIYRPPSLQDLPEQFAVEGDPLTVDLELPPEAFPFPRSVQWFKDGEEAANDTDTSLGYPNAVFDRVNRDDAGMYTLTATNNRLDNDSVEIGTDSASFSLTVIFGPEFNDNIESPSDAAVLQNETVTLVCGKNLAGFPTPDVEWRDNNGALVSNGGRYTISDGPDVVNLTISDTTANDAGNWSCSVSVTGPNGESTDIQLERIIELVVVVPPSTPFLVTADPANIGPTFIRICWQFQESDPGTPPVAFFRILVQPLNMTFTTENGTFRDFNVMGLLPGTEYEFTVTAVSMSGEVEGESTRSSPRIATTTFTVPAPVCDSAPVSEDGTITVTWTYAHTGGLNLTQVEVQYMEPTQDQFEGNVTLDDPNQTSALFTGLEAGSTYLFQITAYNANGNDNVTCPPVTPEIGIPRAPEIQTIATVPGRVALTVLTKEAGINLGSPFFVFDVKVFNGEQSSNYTFQFDGYLDNTEVNLIIDDLEAGRYLFSVRSRNDFGASGFIGAQDLTTIEARGIPRAPEIRNITPGPGRVALTVLTAEAGIDLGSPFFVFDVKVSNGMQSSNYTFQFDGYLDNTEVDLIIDDLEAGRYLFSVRSRNDFGASDFIGAQDLTTIEAREVLLFQLVLSGVQDCAQWVQQNVPNKLEDVTTSVQESVEQLCTCGFTPGDITDSAFECSKINADTVSFRATLHAVNTLEYIEQWREEGPAINVQGLILRVSADSSCPVVIDSITDPLCEPTQMSTSSSEDGNTAGIIGGVIVGVVVLVCVTVVIIIAIIVAHRRIYHGTQSFSVRKSALEMSGGETLYEEIDQDTPTVVPSTHNVAYGITPTVGHETVVPSTNVAYGITPTVGCRSGVPATHNVAYGITTRDGWHQQQ